MIETLAKQGFAIIDDWLPPAQLQVLAAAAERILDAGGRTAGIGRKADHLVDTAIRGDHIAWLTQEDAASAGFMLRMEQLRLELNRTLYLGLFRYECHYACYDRGAVYHKHVDAFKGERNRLLSTVFYLNEGWQPADGGELVLYRDDGSQAATVLPQGNRLVVFLSEEFPHEVRAASRRRYSIAGWFRGAY